MHLGMVIFDCDGVLVDSEILTNRVLAANLTRHGLPMTVEDSVRLFVGGTMAGVGETARKMGADLSDTWLDDIYAEIYETLRQGVDVIPGIPALLDLLDDREIPFCVASNGSLEKMDITLGQNGLLPRFGDRRYSAHSLGVAKPDPGLFVHAARQAGAAPETCVVIEDSATGAEAAARAGMRCLGYAPHDDGAALAYHGAEIISSIDDVAIRLDLT